MDETGDAPEHPWVRWYRGLSAVERFTIQIAAGLFGGGVFLAAVGFGLHTVASPVSALLDRLGWSLIQLGGAIGVVQVVLHERHRVEIRPLAKKAKSDIGRKFCSIIQFEQVLKANDAASYGIPEFHTVRFNRNLPEEFSGYCMRYQHYFAQDSEFLEFIDHLQDILKLEVHCYDAIKRFHQSNSLENRVIIKGHIDQLFISYWFAAQQYHDHLRPKATFLATTKLLQLARQLTF